MPGDGMASSTSLIGDCFRARSAQRATIRFAAAPSHRLVPTVSVLEWQDGMFREIDGVRFRHWRIDNPFQPLGSTASKHAAKKAAKRSG